MMMTKWLIVVMRNKAMTSAQSQIEDGGYGGLRCWMRVPERRNGGDE